MDDSLRLTGSGPILLVDDDDADACLLRRCYEQSDLKNEFLWLASGLAMIEHLREIRAGSARPPALIIVDLQMPGLDGLHTLRILKAQPEQPGPRILVLTNSRNPWHRDKALRLGADAFRLKSADPADTIQFFNSLLAL